MQMIILATLMEARYPLGLSSLVRNEVFCFIFTALVFAISPVGPPRQRAWEKPVPERSPWFRASGAALGRVVQSAPLTRSQHRLSNQNLLPGNVALHAHAPEVSTNFNTTLIVHRTLEVFFDNGLWLTELTSVYGDIKIMYNSEIFFLNFTFHTRLA